MPTILGMRGSGSFTVTGQRPQNWRQGIMHLYPNGDAPLTAILSMLGSEPVNDTQFNWWDKELPVDRIFATAGFGATITALTVDDSAGTGRAQMVRAGTVLLNERTGEIMRVSIDPADVNTINVLRAQGETVAAAINNNDALYVIGSAHEQGAETPTATQTDPTVHYNHTQIFRQAVSMTRTAMRTHLRTGDAYEEAKLEALQRISLDMEKAYMFGERLNTTQNGQVLTQTRGIRTWISTDAPAENNVTPASGDLTITLMNTYMQTLFTNGSNEKLGLCGMGFLRWINELVQTHVNSSIELTDATTTYGMNVRNWITPFGIVRLLTHPLMSRNANYAGDCVLIDTKFIKDRYIDQLKFVPNRQKNGTDGRIDEYIAETGLEFNHPKAHMVISGVTGVAA